MGIYAGTRATLVTLEREVLQLTEKADELEQTEHNARSIMEECLAEKKRLAEMMELAEAARVEQLNWRQAATVRVAALRSRVQQAANELEKYSQAREAARVPEQSASADELQSALVSVDELLKSKGDVALDEHHEALRTALGLPARLGGVPGAHVGRCSPSREGCPAAGRAFSAQR